MWHRAALAVLVLAGASFSRASMMIYRSIKGRNHEEAQAIAKVFADARQAAADAPFDADAALTRYTERRAGTVPQPAPMLAASMRTASARPSGGFGRKSG